jgi:hypothetical protein
MFDNSFFTFFEIISSLSKFSHAICNSKSAQVGGQDDSSTTVIFASSIKATLFLSLSEILIELSFLQYSFFIKFIVILA